MITSIHNITDSIIIRKSFRWRSSIINDEQIINCNSIYHRIEKIMEGKLQKLSLKKNKINVVPCILNLYSVKRRLEETPWIIPGNLNPDESRSFLQDLDFYLMISGTLLKIQSLFSGFVSKCKSLSVLQMLPVFESHPKRVRQTLILLDDSKWLQYVLHHQENNRYLNELNYLEIKVFTVHSDSILNNILTEIYRVFNSEPIHLKDEEEKADLLSRVNQYLKGITIQHQNLDMHSWKHVKPALLLAMQADEKGELYKEYIRCLENLSDADGYRYAHEMKSINRALKKEHGKNAHKHNANPDYIVSLEGIKEYLLTNETLKNADDTEGRFIEWTHNPKEFVKSIHALISKGYLSVKGNSDVLPIIEILSRFVKVRKQNDSGNLGFSSLITYFKKASVGDL